MNHQAEVTHIPEFGQAQGIVLTLLIMTYLIKSYFLEVVSQFKISE